MNSCKCSKNYICTDCIVVAEPHMSRPAPNLLFNWKWKKDMKNCFGCRSNYPLGSGRYHYFINSNGHYETVPCTHNPVTGTAYESDIRILEKMKKKYVKCECGAEKARTTHVDWCPKYE